MRDCIFFILGAASLYAVQWAWISVKNGYSDHVGHGPFAEGQVPWWKIVSVKLVETSPAPGWRLWIYSRWGAWNFDLYRSQEIRD